ncbi:30S ribosomal protein S16 [Candidatus Roizmanbacteria bacterium RIFOXYB2_FULL_41_10]|uniref:Small ribosomal subunit protein bS16 n=1 Tax=Candidatus Roizmanbacteria bacterium RIFOXYA1_FULL_41_12 TaxID=1802082 RepID=A0A1F7KEL4_9BACT|nr:MAG: 30S ribosomal protein S16 [Candidatus Roizmanbacteria bacterium RIFOXYA1_FULL_41_12]OGK66648.1 MAG: 30S ribosomal protein S16 [Candidatus Roizmanbacteria bacterium RIFOXYA2_FULL_41_8]OGK67106.1 MAG: 30S ribosomal protein S16 [Candidatus Roizmanbacteria bacterium RIFOXYB1_FULL_41_27]OGK69033.1 MAG: 30S ribosomal protein S16 [Candidatus Roizmanbacteria bacterium RIFOXYB2_FULL_41_10]OGK71510.1 MAG: 30S ribosomal protein S16 [Candidatus Roizmanbacteria bacterium RIFOXYC1_FULL_41_16]OGK7255
MAVKIRLMRLGKKNKPFYRIVVIDSKSPRNSTYLENLGNYDPNLDKDKVKIDSERVKFWKERGAVVSKGLLRILK